MNDRSREFLREGEREGARYVLSLPQRALIGTAGSALGTQAGSSLELKDYREYQPGDDLRHVDWSAYARSDHLSIRLFCEEVHPRLDLVLDVTRSMALEQSAKERAALALAAFFATVASNSQFARRVWLLGEQLEPIVNVNELPSSWEMPELSAEAENPGDALVQGPACWKAQGVRILLSDLLWNGDPLTAMRHLSERAALVIVIQILAHSDVTPPAPGSYRLIDVETNRERALFVDASVAQRYRDALSRHRENWHQACRQAGAVFTSIVAEEFLTDWHLEDLVRAELLKIK